MSRRLGEQGTTRLRVCVDEEGKATGVEVDGSSGFERLDSAALQAVRRWTFQPARRGSQAVSDCVVVPINWRLDG